MFWCGASEKSWKVNSGYVKMEFKKDGLKRSINNFPCSRSMILVFSACFKKISSQLFDLDIENLVGRGYSAFAIYEITYFLVPESTERLQLVIFLISASCRRTSSGQDQPEIRGSVAHPRALVGRCQESSWSRMMNLRPLLACNWGQYFTFPASDVWSETIHTLARKATLTRLPRQIRLTQAS